MTALCGGRAWSRKRAGSPQSHADADSWWHWNAYHSIDEADDAD